MIKLWKHVLPDARTMVTCNGIIDGFKQKVLSQVKILAIEDIGQHSALNKANLAYSMELRCLCFPLEFV
jgi:hypothetical protein